MHNLHVAYIRARRRRLEAIVSENPGHAGLNGLALSQQRGPGSERRNLGHFWKELAPNLSSGYRILSEPCKVRRRPLCGKMFGMI